VAKNKPQDPRPAPPIVRYAPLGELRVYEISEAEFEKLEAGPPGQLHLNFALAMLPAALTIFITLQSTTIASDRLYIGYQIAFWALAVQGVISLARWRYSSRSYRVLIQEIRGRMPARPIGEQIPMLPDVIESSRGGDSTSMS
jgi:hypothetical protein